MVLDTGIQAMIILFNDITKLAKFSEKITKDILIYVLHSNTLW
jgi:hypothetical protein